MNIDKLRELSAKATKGEWETFCAHWGKYQIYGVDRGLAEMNSYTGLGGQEKALNAEQEANAHFIAALVNWFRVHEAALASAGKDGERWRSGVLRGFPEKWAVSRGKYEWSHYAGPHHGVRHATAEIAMDEAVRLALVAPDNPDVKYAEQEGPTGRSAAIQGNKK